MVITAKRETSYSGERTSLAGISIHNGKILLESQNITAVSTGNIQLLPHRPERLSALIVNNSSTEIVLLYLGLAGAYEEVRLTPHGSFQIDGNFPWTGSIEVGATPTSAVVISEELYLAR